MNPAEVAQWIAGYLGLSEVEHQRIVTAVRIRFSDVNRLEQDEVR